MPDRKRDVDLADALHDTRWDERYESAVVDGFVPTTDQIALVMARARAESVPELRYRSALTRIRSRDPRQRHEGVQILRELFHTEESLRTRIVEVARKEPELIRTLLEPPATARLKADVRTWLVSACRPFGALFHRALNRLRPRRPRRPEPNRVSAPSSPALYRRTVYGSGAVVTFFLTGVTFEALPASAAQLVTNVLQSGSALLAGALCLLATRRSRTRPPGSAAMTPWWLLGVGAVFWGAGQAVWTWLELVRGQEVPYPSLADAGYLPSLVLVTLALLSFARTEQRLRITLDGLVIAVSLLGISWTFVLRDVFQEDSSWLLLLVAYPIGDVINATIVLTAIVQSRARWSVPYKLIAIGVAALTVADSGFLYLVEQDLYVSGRLIDLGWIVAFLLIAVAATHPSAGEPVGAPAPHPSLARMAVPYIALALSVATATWRQINEGSIGGPLFYSGALVLTLISIRQLLMQRETADYRAEVAEALSNPWGSRLLPLWHEATEIHSEALALREDLNDGGTAKTIAERTQALQDELRFVSEEVSTRDRRIAALLGGAR